MAHYFKVDLDEEFERFMKELSDDSFENSNKTPRQPNEDNKEMKKKDPVPWWIAEDDFEDDGLLGTNVSYLKTKKTYQPVMDTEEESAEKVQFLKSSGTSILSVDSLEANELVVSEPHHSTLGLGLDTLEEQEEKEQFFARLEKGLTSSIDYSKLNQELDSDDSAQLKALHRYPRNTEPAEDGCENESEQEELPETYSDDFEDAEDADDPLITKDEETHPKENSESGKDSFPKQEEEKTGMLANVVLLDSFDSVEDVGLSSQEKATPKAKAPPEITDDGPAETGVPYGQSSGDTEALHQAYCHVAHSLGDTGEPRIEASTVQTVRSSIKDGLQENEESSKNVSTTESDLPTVEELMQPIRIDSYGIRAFDLQPISLKKATDSKEAESVGSLPLKTNTNTVSQDTRHAIQFPHKHDESVVLHRTADEGMGSSCPATEEHLDKMYLEILKKKTSVNPSLLPQDDKMNQTSRSQLGAGEEVPVIGKQVPCKKARSTPSLPKRKPQSGLYASARSSGYGKPSSPLQLFSALEKKTSKDNTKTKSVRSIPTSNQFRKREILSGTKLIKPAASNKPSPHREGSPATPKRPEDPSDDSFVQLQTEPLGSYGGNREKELLMLKRAQDAEEKWTGAQALMEQMKMTFCEKEKELENTVESLKRQQERELFRLNQENYILQAKLSSFEETSRKQRWLQFGETSDPLTGEKLKQIQKEIQEQETLLQGYQQENERLYNQVKDLQEQNKKNEERMFKENQNLFSELASLKEQMHKNHFLSQAVENTEPTKNQSFTDLLAELRAAQKEKNHLMEDIKRLKQDKQALEVDLEKVKRERDQAKDQIAYATGEKLYEIKILEETHKQEVSRLQKRLQWYAENQELLDRDAARLREANEETEKLRLEIEKLKTESGSPATQQRLRSKERALDAKRIQDLERQVKEMEGILKRRYPNSLPALILAASAAGDSVDRNTVEFMERRIKKLEADLEGKDEEAKKSLRTMEQQFQKMKIQYEQRLEEQEQLLAHRQKEAPQSQRNSSSRLKALETELGDIKEAHQITVRKLEAEIDVLKHQNADLEHKKNDKGDQGLQSIEFQVEQAQARAKLARLNEELAAKGREIQDLTKTVERLQKERRMMLSRQIPRSREETAAKRLKKDPNRGHGNAFPETLDGKLYHPHTFTDSHISEVLEENYRLRSELEGLILERSKLKMESEAAVCQLENSMKRVKDDAAAHIASLKASHEREIEKLLCQNAIENSSSKVAELNRKIATQEVLLKHFQGQVNELQGKQESLAVSQVREEILQKQITKLLEELKEAKENHTPEMKHFMGLERKIKQMEMRHRQREQELQQIIQQTRQVVETEQNKEVEKWKRLAQLKNRELDKFRTELDSILDVLRELHRQGVVVPMALAGEENTAEF
ncbi:centrosomal protein of 162 kDa [Mus musculus]|uniref:Centrosomal protein of 162 kDa n=2 Tax=Mus musculus TaxID=10090 RepID=CE162_MOUSE|nr:centrosomal protein of 162 kDa [Mus musculus]Q6ZQ06.2 RecName: Full=Centrosomal protein of 162 kDa; Short=Cep162; AltName: Full=Protein QN1 homolog [Mus musculus]AAI50999.1 RIKEN cDNA 4922501C03 gene [Mus musculus]AAI51007.1 RIKEN cDNA 4922501C03 gene [Mus musculus]|eukprot:NP_955020.2 centrosomal protein of 162 kDa [Mus musculus]